MRLAVSLTVLVNSPVLATPPGRNIFLANMSPHAELILGLQHQPNVITQLEPDFLVFRGYTKARKGE
jgi:hypothetical protein